MVHVIASIYVKKGNMSAVHKIYRTFVPKVNAENGCLMYLPTTDYKTDITTQLLERNIITVIEKWEDMAAFKAHLSASHVVEFRRQIEGLVEKVSIKVLKDMLT